MAGVEAGPPYDFGELGSTQAAHCLTSDCGAISLRYVV